MIRYKHRVAACVLPLLLAFAGCSQNPQANGASEGADTPAAADKPGVLGQIIFESSRPETVPEGTALEVVLNQTISSGESRSGASFDATLAAPIVIEGKTVIPRHSTVRGHVVDSEASGRLKGVAHLDLTLNSVEVNGKSYDLETSNISRSGQNHKRNAELIGGSAGVGALIGGLAGGGKGALIGGAAGAGAGTGTAAYTGKKDIRIPAETRLSFQLSRPLTITVND
jgi:hypothetical protein